MQLSKNQSQAINVVKVLCMFGVIYIHASVVPYVDCSPAMLYYQQFITRVLTSFAVPGFFMCSGFLYFLNFDGLDSYNRKSISRFKSLVIPYLFWISFTLFVTWFLQDVLGLAHLFGAGEMKLIREFTLLDFANSFWCIRDGAPFLSTMWFLRDLIVCVAITPQLYLLLRGKHGRVTLGVILILSIMELSFLEIAASSIFWFSLGAFLAIHQIDVFSGIKKYQKTLITTGLVLVLAYSFVYIENRESRILFYSILQLLTTIILFANILLLTMNLVNERRGKELARLAVPSYFIYLAHEPYMGYVLQLFIKLINFTPPLLHNYLYSNYPYNFPNFHHYGLPFNFQGTKKMVPARIVFGSWR